MGKIQNICDYIKQCDECISTSDSKRANVLLIKILGVYSDEISNITGNLDCYSYNLDKHEIDFLGDIDIMKAKLNNLKDNIEMEERKSDRELEKLKLKQSVMNFNNTATNTNDNTASSIATNNINVSFDQAIENIQELDDNKLTKGEKDELEDKLAGIEAALKKKDKSKLLAKIGAVLKYVADKSVEVGIAVLPYLGEVAKYIP